MTRTGARGRRWSQRARCSDTRKTQTCRSTSAQRSAGQKSGSGIWKNSARRCSFRRTRTTPVLPEADPAEVELKPEDLEIKASTSTGLGGQCVNTTYSAIRMTHKLTGLVVSIQDEKSQLQNKEMAMRVLRARLYEMKLAEQQEAIGAQRRGMVRTGNRSEKIRTYNFKDNRVTDHRINLTLHKHDRVMAGDLDDLVSALIAAERAAQLNGGPDGQA